MFPRQDTQRSCEFHYANITHTSRKPSTRIFLEICVPVLVFLFFFFYYYCYCQAICCCTAQLLCISIYVYVPVIAYMKFQYCNKYFSVFCCRAFSMTELVQLQQVSRWKTKNAVSKCMKSVAQITDTLAENHRETEVGVN